MKRLKDKFMTLAWCVCTVISTMLVGCSDDPGLEHYYTSTKEYAADYLKNREQFSDFIQIMERATGEKDNLRLMDLLSTYGSYTVFAPTNDAVQEYLKERNLSSIDELSKEDCDTIALNSIIEQAYFTSDQSSESYGKTNMLDLYMQISSVEETDENGENPQLVMYINNNARLTHVDDSVANGVVHTVGSVVGRNNQMLQAMLEKDQNIILFRQALDLTGWSNKLNGEDLIDKSYSVGSDSVDWTNKALVFHTASECDNVAYMERRYIKYTVFAEPDEVLNTKLQNEGFEASLDGLKEYARKIYYAMYPEFSDETFEKEMEGGQKVTVNVQDDPTHEHNYLNLFMAYHILPFDGAYYKLTYYDGEGTDLPKCFNRRKADICDYYETMMPHSLMKFSYPSGKQAGLYINRCGVQSRPDQYGRFERGAKVAKDTEMKEKLNNVTSIGRNGRYYYIDDVIAYGERTQKYVLNERIRLDASTLSPDFITSGARGFEYEKFSGNGKYANSAGENYNPLTNNAHCLGFKAGSAKNFIFNDNTHIHIRPRYIWFWSYEGDEMLVKGRFNFIIKLPPVPAGTYEVRFMTCVGFKSRGIMQAYLGEDPDDMTAQGIPFDMRPGGGALFGYKSDTDLGDDETIAAFDKAIHNQGWMKGPGNYIALGNTYETIDKSFRNQDNTIRKVLGTFKTDGKTDQYMRIQQMIDSPDNELNFDFIELCPSTIYKNEYIAEDKW